ncbi:MAG TPA: hypothetical protein VFY40_21945 [Blastocatellia bacterium]|nr:hypothetical protein [Blastocatellia bacterium]
MELPGISKIRLCLNHGPVWRRFIASAIFFGGGLFISKILSYRLRNGGWDMDWGDKLGESLISGILFGIYAAWPRKSVGKNEQGERQSS